MHIKTDIIPSSPLFIGEKKDFDYKAICVFAATGFFLDQDTYYLDQKVLKPAHDFTIENNKITAEKKYFNWHYSPIERPFNQVVEEFAALFEKIIEEQVGSKKVILPISGGLDSRTQAAALAYMNKNVSSFSYEFENGLNETYYAKKIAEVCKFPFQKWIIPKSYLWNDLEKLAKINNCYTEFTHPRQAAILDKFHQMGDVFSLGHWGDVLFDGMKVDDLLPFDKQVEFLTKKIVKKGGVELAEKLWKTWNIEGDFKTYLNNRINLLLKEIAITDNANAQIRAFKSLYWAPRWTSVNLSFFEAIKPIALPYYDERMCEFICSVPEKYLAGRQIQIAYLKMRNPNLAKISWQDQRPFNLYNFHWNKAPWNLPYRAYHKFKKEFLSKNRVVNNYENQFLGKENDENLKFWLFKNQDFKKLVEEELTKEIYEKFKGKESLKYSHPISTLLTLSLFSKINSNGKV